MLHRRFRQLVLGLSLSLLAAAPIAAEQKSPTSPEDIPQPVPGDLGMAGKRCPDISRFLNIRTAVAPSLSPDGTQVAYRTGITGQPQLWVTSPVQSELTTVVNHIITGQPPQLWVTSPEGPQQITFGESVTAHDWSPTGEWLAYAVDRGGNEREGFYLISADGKRERELLPPSESFRDWGGWSRDGKQVAYAATEPGKADFNIYVLDVATGKSRRVYTGQGGTYVAAWRPDGRGLLLTRVRGEDANDLLYLDLTTGQLSELLVPAEATAQLSPVWTPDSRGFYLVSNDRRDFTALTYFDFARRQVRPVAAPEHDVEQTALSKDGRYLAWSENVEGFSQLKLRDLRSNRTMNLTGLPAGVVGALTWAERTPRLAIQLSGSQVPGDLWTYDAEHATLRRATTSATAGLTTERFAVPKAVNFPSHDGEQIHGLLYQPTGATVKMLPPAIVMVHGGPTSQARPDFDGITQYLVARGYVVLDLNFRGSTGYGKRFARLDNGRLRPNAVKDMASAVDWLGTQGVNGRRVAVMGGSYGGYLTFAALATLPEKFQAGVGFVGVSNWVSALEGASPTLKASDRYEYGNIDDPADREFFRQLSPITNVEQVRAPLMVLHGANDPRDPVGEADQLVAAIRTRGGDVEYLRFPDEGHGIRKLTNRVIAYRRIATFLERTLGKGIAVCGE